jgi:hypothetical protein
MPIRASTPLFFSQILVRLLVLGSDPVNTPRYFMFFIRIFSRNVELTMEVKEYTANREGGHEKWGKAQRSNRKPTGTLRSCRAKGRRLPKVFGK